MSGTSYDLVLASVRLPSGEGPTEIAISGGRIVAIGSGLAASASRVEDAAGAVVLPALTDAHCHVDKTVWGSGRWLSHSAGRSLADRIANNVRIREEWGIPNREFTTHLLNQIVANGTTRIRTHTDLDTELGLSGVEMVASLAEEFAGRLDIEQVAFPQQGLVGKPGLLALIEQATSAGVSVIGGIDPAGRDRDPVKSLDEMFGLAVRTGCSIDIHLHDHGLLGAWEIDLICERTIAEDMRGRVTLSHAYALGDIDDNEQRRLADLLVEAQIGIVTAVPFDSAVLPLRMLRDVGVPVGLGNDSIRNTWSPFGTADMLQRAMIAGTRYEARSDDELSWILSLATDGGARVMGVEPAVIAVGAPADLVLVEALNEYDAVVSVPPRRLVLKAGVPVARDGEALPAGAA